MLNLLHPNTFEESIPYIIETGNYSKSLCRTRFQCLHQVGAWSLSQTSQHLINICIAEGCLYTSSIVYVDVRRVCLEIVHTSHSPQVFMSSRLFVCLIFMVLLHSKLGRVWKKQCFPLSLQSSTLYVSPNGVYMTGCCVKEDAEPLSVWSIYRSFLWAYTSEILEIMSAEGQG